MIKRSTLIWTLLALIAGASLFIVKHQVQELESQLAVLDRAIARDREAVHVLRAEWSHLNQPARLEALGIRLLGMAPPAASDTMDVIDLEQRLRRESTTPKSRLARVAPGRTNDQNWLAPLLAKLGRRP